MNLAVSIVMAVIVTALLLAYLRETARADDERARRERLEAQQEIDRLV
jgi:hypothetical protein